MVFEAPNIEPFLKFHLINLFFLQKFPSAISILINITSEEKRFATFFQMFFITEIFAS